VVTLFVNRWREPSTVDIVSLSANTMLLGLALYGAWDAAKDARKEWRKKHWDSTVG